MNTHVGAIAEHEVGSVPGRSVLSLSGNPGTAHCLACFSVGGVSVQLASRCPRDVVLIPTLEPFRVESCVPDINIQVKWVARLSPPSGRELFDSGAVWRLHEGEAGFQFDFSAPILGVQPYKRLLVDAGFRQATLQMNEQSFAGVSCEAGPLEYPLDELLIMHRLTQERAIELHGVGIVGPDGASNLFVGHSGAGKSTTARLWTSLHDVEILSDDRIIVREDLVREGLVREDDDRRGADGLETPCRDMGVGELKQVLRLRDCSASRTNHSVQDDRFPLQLAQDGKAVLQLAQHNKTKQHDKAKLGRGGMRMYGTPWHGEAHFALPQSAPLQRIFVLEHGQDNVLTRLSRSQVVGELFARSFVPFHRHEYVDSALSFLERLADTVPCYRYSFEPDERAVERVLAFRD
jgi:hypothetical protein